MEALEPSKDQFEADNADNESVGRPSSFDLTMLDGTQDGVDIVTDTERNRLLSPMKNSFPAAARVTDEDFLSESLEDTPKDPGEYRDDLMSFMDTPFMRFLVYFREYEWRQVWEEPVLFVSRSVHEELMAFFIANTPDPIFVRPILDFNSSLFNLFHLYTTMLPNNPNAHVYPLYSYPPPLRQVIEECLLFYQHTLHPYFGEEESWETSEGLCGLTYGRIMSKYVDMLYRLGSLKSQESIISERWAAGLLRNSQVEILQIILRMLLKQISAILAISGIDETVRLDRLTSVCTQTDDYFMKCFIVSRRFRSERLEVLLLKYLAEENVNWDVVEGLEEAQRVYETDERTEEDYIYRPPMYRYLQ
ncbi:hypothetical protein BJ508DRAFT_367733 [Ascobolus immersus RN42]|uniref:Uncharacterized protein n=1 Tax=Ascobolus immersus RN42 TaxID=1160509 RepID=A0A3N4HHH8_ASCIM|nr:hypothetical protein BJ508DRAFT_367733 [Ascobolus immersus RN42]